MANENYSNFTRTRPNKGFYQPNLPENHRKEREERRGARATEIRTSTVFSVYSVGFREDAYLGLFLPYCNALHDHMIVNLFGPSLLHCLFFHDPPFSGARKF